MTTIIEEVQAEVDRIKGRIRRAVETFPEARVEFLFLRSYIREAETAIREQDAVKLVRILPVIREML